MLKSYLQAGFTLKEFTILNFHFQMHLSIHDACSSMATVA